MFFCPYAIAYAEVAKIHGDAEAADEIIAEARQYCKENNFKKRYELLCSFGLEQKAPIENGGLGLKTVSAEEIVKKAEYIGLWSWE